MSVYKCPCCGYLILESVIVAMKKIGRKECPCCGYLVLESAIVAMEKIGRKNCNNPGVCDEPFDNFKLPVEEKC